LIVNSNIIDKIKIGLNRIKDYLSKKGFESLRSIGKTFRKMKSYDGYNKISKEDLKLAFRDLGINLDKDDLNVINKYRLVKLYI